MMLIMSGIGRFDQEIVTINEHTISTEWIGRGNTPIYWRTGDLSKSFLEIGLEPQNGRVVSITLLLAQNVSILSPEYCDLRRRDIPQQPGVPMFDIKAWPPKTYYFDELGPLILRIGNHNVVIEMGTDIEITSCIVADLVSFGIDTLGVLRIIEIQGLSSEKMTLINHKFNQNR
ncbi:MAG: hypothetical protein K8I60_04820 [Anaerolineae bacterium]|nr:hypothetical protein [Anaerolineae bacterium]